MLSESPFVIFTFLCKSYPIIEVTCCYFISLSILKMNEKEERWEIYVCLCLLFLLSPVKPAFKGLIDFLLVVEMLLVKFSHSS